ncbi:MULTISPECIES: hypothetical protein [Niastella]|uniref:Uncharacterized protein n=1 Tax=Niastella soli TaxID=2821487 RepID=A0ABS3YU25_9BACT|nr:hypothetical protein [Niastella soli]MBO9201422.1 hypothetical protein [Niastella soli]
MKLVITLLLVAFCFTSFAQTDPIVRNAVFKSFEEFKSNTPSIHPINLFLEQTGEDKYLLSYQDSAGNMKEYKESLWGFSDNENVYIKYNKHYARFMAIGKISVFKFFQESETKWSTSSSTTVVSTPVGTTITHNAPTPFRYKTKEKGEVSYILDMNTGKITTLKASAVKKLISNDAELSAEYNQLGEYNQERDKLAFLRKYNERNPM